MLFDENYLMKKSFYIFLFISITIFSSSFSQSDFYEKHFEIDSTEFSFRNFKNNLSVKEIDSLKFYNRLDRFEYPNLTVWGGLELYYYCNQIVYIEAQSNGEFQGVKRSYYLDSSRISKIISSDITIDNKEVHKIEFLLNDKGHIINDLDEFIIDYAYNLYKSGNSIIDFLKKEKLEKKYWNAKDLYLTQIETDSLIYEIDNKIKDSTLIKYSLKNMHPCGGVVDGYFNNLGELKYVYSNYGSPSGYIERQLYFYNNKIVYNSYREINDEMGKDIFYLNYETGDDILKDLSKEKLQFPYMDFIRSVNVCATSMERDLILEYKTKD